MVTSVQAGPIPLPFQVKADLREYQMAGISWLAFLRKCGLHGVLADDMGLGKTLQTTVILAGSSPSHAPSMPACWPLVLPLHERFLQLKANVCSLLCTTIHRKQGRLLSNPRKLLAPQKIHESCS